MKFLKYILFIILIVIITTSVYFGAKNGKFDTGATRTMEVPAAVLYEQINNYTTWQEWGPWMELDPEIQINLGDTLIGIGAGYRWKSNHPDIGSGSIITNNTVENKSIEQQITFSQMFGASAHQMNWNITPAEDGLKTTVTWRIKGELTLIEKILVAFNSESKSATNELYAAGLEKLEQSAKASMEQYTVNFDGISEYGGGYYLFVTATTTQAQLATRIAPMMGQVAGYMQANRIAHSGKPFTIYNQVDSTIANMIVSAAIPVKERILTTAESEVLCGYMPPLTAIKTTLRGNYINLDKAYARGLQYIKEKGLTIDPQHPMFEIYVSDPGEIPNPSNWVTQVYIPIITPQETIN